MERFCTLSPSNPRVFGHLTRYLVMLSLSGKVFTGGNEECSESAMVVSLRIHMDLSRCETEPAPSVSKRSLPLTKCKPISNAGGTSVTVYLRKGKNSVQHKM